MRGPEDACQLVTARLKASVPARLAALEQRLGLPADTIPRPVSYLPHDVAQLPTDQTPTMLTVAQDTPTVTPREPDDGLLVWDVTYRLRVFTFARGRDYLETDQRRKRLALVAREALLAAPILADDAELDTTGWRESYSDVLTEREGRSLAGAYLELSVSLRETLPLESLGTASTTVVDEELLEHPAL